MRLERVCVFTGSRDGARSIYAEAATDLGRAMAARNIELVYGGASVGSMGKIADSVLAHKGRVIGVIPEWLRDREIAHRSLTELRVTASMHERKRTMADLADAFIAMPGGFGTLDELFEILTWAQIGLHQKPVGLLNVANFFDPLLKLIEHMTREGFAAPEHASLFVVKDDAESLLDALTSFAAPVLANKWKESDKKRA
jgi:uncharacterized protein (TIGR00730 family)